MIGQKKILLICLYVLFGCNSKVKISLEGNVFLDLSNNRRIVFDIKNNSNDTFYVFLKDPDLSVMNDSLIIEAYNPNSNIDYYSFPEPKLECLEPQLIIKGEVSSISFVNFEFKQYKYFIRVFKKSFQNYIIEENIDVVSEDDFLQFQRRFSNLIPLKLSEYSYKQTIKKSV
jgi:hypothetical protein